MAAVAALDPTPRQRRWTSLTYCTCDAVWSIGAHDDRVGTPLVHRVAAALGDDAARFSSLEQALSRLPGEGQHGVRRGCLWMLAGDEHRVKPDRMVLRWLQRHGHHVDAPAAAELLSAVAAQLSSSGQHATAREADHAVWIAQRTSHQACCMARALQRGGVQRVRGGREDGGCDHSP